MAGLVTAAAHSIHVSHTNGLRAGFGVGLFAIGAAAVLWRPGRSHVATPAHPRLADLATLGLTLQTPCLLLVSAVGLVFPLVPLVLVESHGFSAVGLGLVTGLGAVSRMLGSVLGGRLVDLHGSSRAVVAMLAAAAIAAVAEVAFNGLPIVFVALVLAIYVGAIGTWPICVAATLARIDPPKRSAMSAVWNLREYAAIAASAAVSGALFEFLGTAIPFVLAAGLLFCAALVARTVLRRPILRPQPMAGATEVACTGE